MKYYCFDVLKSKSFKNLSKMKRKYSFNKKFDMMKDFDILAINQHDEK